MKATDAILGGSGESNHAEWWVDSTGSHTRPVIDCSQQHRMERMSDIICDFIYHVNWPPAAQPSDNDRVIKAGISAEPAQLQQLHVKLNVSLIGIVMADHEFVPFKKKVCGCIFYAKSGQSAQCKLCKTILQTVGGSTKGLHEHLKRRHNITLKRKADDGDGDGNLEQTSKGNYFIRAYDSSWLTKMRTPCKQWLCAWRHVMYCHSECSQHHPICIADWCHWA